MITLALSEFVFIYLFAFLGVVFFAWFRHNITSIRWRRAALRNRILCRLCCFEFEAPPEVDLPTCPRCHHPTEREGPHPV